MSAGNVLQNRDARFDKIKEFVNSEKFQQDNAERAKAANLNRAERKYLDRKNAKFRKTFNKLNPAQFEMVEDMANSKANDKIEEFKYIIDTNLSALLIEYLPEKTQEELYQIQGYYSQLVDEFVEKYKKLEESCKGDEDIMSKKMEKYEKDVTAVCEELAQKGIKQKDAVEELMTKFPMLSKSMLMNAYKKTKSEYDKATKIIEKVVEIEDPDVADGVEAIMDIINEGEDEVMVDKIIEEADKFVEQAEKEQPKVVCDDKSCSIVENVKQEPVQTEVKKPGLKVLTMTVQGENGTYKVCQNGVELENKGLLINFENEAQFNKWVGEYREVFSMLG